MLHLVYLLLTPQKFDVFGRRQIRRDLVATVSSKVGRLPLPDIISTNVPRSWTLCKCSSRRNSPRTNFVKGFSSPVAFEKDVRCRFSLNENVVVFGSRWQSGRRRYNWRNIYASSEVRRQLRINRGLNGIFFRGVGRINWNSQIRETIIIAQLRSTYIIAQYISWFEAYLILEMK